MGRPLEFDKYEVLDRALHVFWRKGYTAASMQDLVIATGINKASIYNSFGDKEAFFVAVIEHYIENYSRPRGRLLVETEPARQAVANYFESLVRFSVGEGAHLGCLLTNVASEIAPFSPPVEAHVSRVFNMMEGVFLDTILRGQEDGSIKTRLPPIALARMMLNAVQGIRLQSRVRPDEAVLRDVVSVVMAMLDC
ncbi:MAG: TetR/AcrR family transcriptional regulator [Hyphomicrobiales bacterium]